ncbi:MAG: COG1615 family transporter, partial [Caldilineaceae bacterium]|nr:COG1615 family transporter [Caldilineaceae bacterium]
MKNTDPFADLIRSIEENLQGGGDSEPPGQSPNRTPRPAMPEGNPRRLLWFLIPLLIFIFFNRFLDFYADWYWYGSLGLTSVFTTRIWAEVGLFLVGAVVFWLFLAINVLLAIRMEPFGMVNTPLEEAAHSLGVRLTPVILIVGAMLAFFMGLTAAANWEEVLIFLNQSSFGLTDPIFGRDVGFFIFSLPIWEALRGWLLTMVILTLIATAIVTGIGWRGWQVRTRVLAHLSILGALILLLIAAATERSDILRFAEIAIPIGARYPAWAELLLWPHAALLEPVVGLPDPRLRARSRSGAGDPS